MSTSRPGAPARSTAAPASMREPDRFAEQYATVSAAIVLFAGCASLARLFRRPAVTGARQQSRSAQRADPRPHLLILDEPTTGLDPLSRKRFWELIDRIRGERPGMSVMVATADMEVAERFDHLVAIDAGPILASGTPTELHAHPGKGLHRVSGGSLGRC